MSQPPVLNFNTEWSRQLDKVWVLETVGKEDRGSTIGGAICIEPRGLLLTVAHVLAVSGLSRKDCSTVGRAYRDSGFISIDVIEVNDALDLALVLVNEQEKKPNEEFPCISLQDHASVSVGVNEEVVSYVHNGHLPFSFKCGHVCYPFPRDLHLGNIYQLIFANPNLTLAADYREPERSRSELQDYKEYRKLLDCVDRDDKALNDLHPDMPLIQLQGFGQESGMSGCPVFKKADGELIGLFCFVNHQSQFIIPTSFLHYFVEHWKTSQQVQEEAGQDNV